MLQIGTLVHQHQPPPPHPRIINLNKGASIKTHPLSYVLHSTKSKGRNKPKSREAIRASRPAQDRTSLYKWNILIVSTGSGSIIQEDSLYITTHPRILYIRWPHSRPSSLTHHTKCPAELSYDIWMGIYGNECTFSRPLFIHFGWNLWFRKHFSSSYCDIYKEHLSRENDSARKVNFYNFLKQRKKIEKSTTPTCSASILAQKLPVPEPMFYLLMPKFIFLLYPSF